MSLCAIGIMTVLFLSETAAFAVSVPGSFETARDVVEEQGIGEMLISISHCRSHATAYALAVGK